MRWLTWGLFALMVWAVTGCGGANTGTVERSTPLPRERFPQEKRQR